MKETYITIRIYHDEIGNEDLHYMARQAAEQMADMYPSTTDVKVRIDPDDVTVHTTPFRVE